MKALLLFFGLLLSVSMTAQFKAGERITISDIQEDDIYMAGETLKINNKILGDAVAAGGKIYVADSVAQDLLVAGGEIMVTGYVADDIRAAGGTLTIDSEVGDDVIVFGGEVRLTKEAVIHGNLICYSGNVDVEGEVRGMMKVHSGTMNFSGTVLQDAYIKGGNITIDGTIRGGSTLIAKSIKIGDQAKFYSDVAYWSEAGELPFENALINAKAVFNEELGADDMNVPWKTIGFASIGFWIFYVLSAFLVILLLNTAFKKLFSIVVLQLDKSMLPSLGYGLLYLVGMPLLIAICIAILIGIPIGLFLLGFYLFSLLFGHLVVALLLSHFFNKRNEKPWNFWTLVLLALAIAIVIRLITLIPILGGLISFLIIAVAYGAIGRTLVIHRKEWLLKI